MTYDELIPELKTVRYCCHRLIELNLELEVLNHQTTGLARSGIELTAEQKRSKLPMPTYQHQYHSPLGLFEEISAKEQELHHFQKRLMDLRWMELLDLQDQKILWDLYIHRIKAEEVAEKYGYTRRGLYKHLMAEVKKGPLFFYPERPPF